MTDRKKKWSSHIRLTSEARASPLFEKKLIKVDEAKAKSSEHAMHLAFI